MSSSHEFVSVCRCAFWCRLHRRFFLCFQIAVKISKYRFALTLMSKQMDDEKLRVVNSEKQNLLHSLAATALQDINWELQERVSTLSRGPKSGLQTYFLLNGRYLICGPTSTLVFVNHFTESEIAASSAEQSVGLKFQVLMLLEKMFEKISEKSAQGSEPSR